mmetsp:Transcript_35381/g.43257  ORF Transcript_35381/g.43257 Transcript_35381/m.43257 type:complete len:158 (+) Transcript_35381:4504-4977(+)
MLLMEFHQLLLLKLSYLSEGFITLASLFFLSLFLPLAFLYRSLLLDDFFRVGIQSTKEVLDCADDLLVKEVVAEVILESEDLDGELVELLGGETDRCLLEQLVGHRHRLARLKTHFQHQLAPRRLHPAIRLHPQLEYARLVRRWMLLDLEVSVIECG